MDDRESIDILDRFMFRKFNGHLSYEFNVGRNPVIMSDMKEELLGTIKELIEWIQEERTDEGYGVLKTYDDCDSLYQFADAYISNVGPITFMTIEGYPITISRLGCMFDYIWCMYSSNEDMPDKPLDLTTIVEVLE